MIRGGFEPSRRLFRSSNTGLQMLVLSDGLRRVQVRCAGKDVRLDPFSLEPVVEGGQKVRSSIQHVDVLISLFKPNKFRQ